MGQPSPIQMPPARLTVLLCGSSALLTLVLALTSVPSWRGSDIPFLLLAVIPYLALAALAAGLQRSRRWSWSLFGLTVALSWRGLGASRRTAGWFTPWPSTGWCSASP